MMLVRAARALFSRQKPTDALKRFLEQDVGASVRRERSHKERKYINVEIAENFKRQEQERKELRLHQMMKRKQLLEQQLSTQSKLLTAQEQEELKNLDGQITTLNDLLAAQKAQLEVVEGDLEKTEASYMLVEGGMKLVVLNRVTYLQHMNAHPSGLVLHPESVKAIENVHYLVNNNLPVNKYKVFELMPDLFEEEINQLDDSMKKLIEERQLDPDSTSSSRLRFFMRHKERGERPDQDQIDLEEQREDTWINLQLEISKMLLPHQEYINKMEAGQTPFRDSRHLVNVMTQEDLPLKLDPQEQALRDTMLEVEELKRKFEDYNDEMNKKKIAARFKYVQPPEWVANHPRLLARYEKMMERYMSATPYEGEEEDKVVEGGDGGRAWLEGKFKELYEAKYEPMIVRMWNEGQKEELINNKKKMEIEFYNDATRLLEEYNELQLESREQQEFLKIPKMQREIKEAMRPPITLDQLTKALFLNHQQPKKYDLNFFTGYFGIDSPQETQELFDSFSYLRVKPQAPKEDIGQLEWELIKFREA